MPLGSLIRSLLLPVLFACKPLCHGFHSALRHFPSHRSGTLSPSATTYCTMPVRIELLLLNPAPRVVMGLPIFISRDAGLLHTMLHHHGEWRDHSSHWHVWHCRKSAELILQVGFGRTTRSFRYADKLANNLGPVWTVIWPLKLRRDDSKAQRAEGTLVPEGMWVSMADGNPARVANGAASILRDVPDDGFTCGGALALDMSAMPAKADRQIEAIVTRLLAIPKILALITARPGHCLLFHLASARCGLDSRAHGITFDPVRFGRLPNREHGCLFEANLRFLRPEAVP